jgi:SsrA-binding protein
MATYATNRKARYDYEFLETFEAGIVLEGAEVKSVRAGRISLKESYVKLKDGELFLTQAHIQIPQNVPQYARFDETQDRKLLMHRKQINKLASQLKEKGLTLLISEIYQPSNAKKIKVKIVLARGKNNYNKKQTIKERDIKRDMERTIKNY